MPHSAKADKYNEKLEFLGDASVVYWDLFGGWRVWDDFYIRPGARLVSNNPQAFLESSLLDFRAGLDDSLSDDGRSRVACLVQKG